MGELCLPGGPLILPCLSGLPEDRRSEFRLGLVVCRATRRPAWPRRRGDRIGGLLTSANGTGRKSRDGSFTSVVGGSPENIISLRALPPLVESRCGAVAV